LPPWFWRFPWTIEALPLNAAAPELNLSRIFILTQRLLSSIGVLHGAAALLPLNRLLLHPTAIAAWVGMFATTLNLLPGGQLDGGHIVFSLAPRMHKFVSRLTILILLPMGITCGPDGWSGNPAAAKQLAAPPGGRVAAGVGRADLAGCFCLVHACAHMMPAPFAHLSVPEVVRQFRQP